MLLLWLGLAHANAPLAYGAALTTASYGNTVLFTTAMVAARAHPASPPEPRLAWLYLPVAGPPLYLATTPSTPGLRRLLVADTVLQATGVALLVHGAGGTQKSWTLTPQLGATTGLVLHAPLPAQLRRKRASSAIHHP